MSENDPQNDFPIHEKVEDAFGNFRSFTITYEALPMGYRVAAEEDTQDDTGYRFTAFNESSPYGALWSLRRKMYRDLAKRHITTRDNRYSMLHDHMRGRIIWSQENGLALIVDGHQLDLDDLETILAAHEGWQFRLQVVDEYDDFG